MRKLFRDRMMAVCSRILSPFAMGIHYFRYRWDKKSLLLATRPWGATSVKPFFYAILLLLLAHCPVLSQQIFFNKVLPPEGKTFVHVTGMVQDKSGYMWFATKKGLFRYDGYDMVSFKNHPSDSTSLTTDALESICVDSAGILWIATFGKGLERFDPVTGIFTHYRKDPKDEASLSSDWIPSLLVDHEGILWVGTTNGLDRFNARTGKFIHYRNQPNDPTTISCNDIRTIYEDRLGIIWVGTGTVYYGKDHEGGLNRMDKTNGKFTRYLHDRINPRSLINNKVKAIFEDSKGIFWVGTSGDGLHTMDRASGKFQRHLYNEAHPEKLSRPPFKKKPYLDYISFITEDITGAIWIGTSESGLNHYDPKTKKITHYELEKDTAGAFTDANIWATYTSRDGVVWISTTFGSIYRINPLRLQIPYFQSAGCSVSSFHEEKDGTLWTGTHTGLQVRIQGKDLIKRFVHDPGNPASLSNNSVQVIRQDREANIWVGTTAGLNLWDKDKEGFIRYTHDPKNNNSLSNDYILTVYESRNTDLWIGTVKGLNRLNRRSGLFNRYLFHPEDSTSTLYLNVVTSVLEDSKGQMWVGCGMAGDVHLLNPQNGEFKTYLKGKGIISFFEDSDQILWTGGEEGLFKYNRSTDAFDLYVDSTTETTFSFVRSIDEDEQKNLWIGTIKGILQLNRQRIVMRVFGKNYGIIGNNLNERSCYKGQQGKLYFGAYSGYFVFTPDQLMKGAQPPQIVFSDFRFSGSLGDADKEDFLNRSLSQVKNIRLQHDQNSFSFGFAAIDYSSPEDNRHFFMLENYDRGWNQAGSERKALYSYVPPGNYIFRVKAASSNGIWSEKSINLVITPPWWHTWWFRTGAVIGVIALLFGLIRWRLYEKFRQQLKHAEKEKQLADLRHKTIELEMQALRAQMNPHFIFNCLSSINGFILKNESEPASDYLTKFSRLIRMVLTNSKKTFITLEDELEMLRLYLEMERLRFQNSFDYTILFKNEIDPENIFIPPLLLQPFAENAIWHGLMNKQGQGHLEVSLSLEEKILTCVIVDNGIGRKKAATMKSKSAEKHKSMGLQITAERLALLNQDIGVKTFFDIEDIADNKGNAAGTKVILRMHYRDLTEAIA